MKRSDQRKQAVFALYQHDLTGRPLEDLFDDQTTDFARALSVETLDGQGAIDATLERHIKDGWTLQRVAPLERNILRVGVFELEAGDVPAEVALDEAVELAKRYCGAEAPKFVNGVLAAVLRGRPAEGGGAATGDATSDDSADAAAGEDADAA